MKKFLILITLLASLGAGAQTITEANLLGKWQVTGIDIYGVKADLKKNITTVDEAIVKAAGITTDQLEKIKAVAPEMGEQLRSNVMIFTPGMQFESVQPDKSGKGTYSLKDEGGIQYMTLVKEPDVFIVSLRNGVLNMAAASAPYIIMCLTKTE